MKMTSAEANKLIRKLNEEHSALLRRENEDNTFVAATIEKLEDARPEYDYENTQSSLAAIEEQIRVIKHAVNAFNVTQIVPGTNMTIDQVLVYIPQLSDRKRKLSAMRGTAKKQRNDVPRGTNLIEYTYANFDVGKADADYLACTDELARVQNALDLINSTVEFEVEL